jgi:ABC-2 type transport system ATP-binding protein
MSAAIATEALTKVYPGGVRALDGVTLTVEQGEVVGLLGPNGAGKTTLIRTLVDLIRPTAGRATILGRDVRRDAAAVHGQLGYLAGDLRLPLRLTGRELLESLGRLRGGVPRAAVDRLAQRLEVDLDRPLRQLSKGNRQKVGLIQAFMHEPAVLVVDEPTSGLDPLAQEIFRALVLEHAGRGAAVLLSSHVLGEVEHVAHRVAIIRQGVLVAVEEIAALRARAVRHVTVRTRAPVPAGALEALPNVHVESQQDGIARLTVEGSMDALIRLLAPLGVEDLGAEHADLEEIFLSYYRETGDGRH